MRDGPLRRQRTYALLLLPEQGAAVRRRSRRDVCSWHSRSRGLNLAGLRPVLVQSACKSFRLIYSFSSVWALLREASPLFGGPSLAQLARFYELSNGQKDTMIRLNFAVLCIAETASLSVSLLSHASSECSASSLRGAYSFSAHGEIRGILDTSKSPPVVDPLARPIVIDGVAL